MCDGKILTSFVIPLVWPHLLISPSIYISSLSPLGLRVCGNDIRMCCKNPILLSVYVDSSSLNLIKVIRNLGQIN